MSVLNARNKPGLVPIGCISQLDSHSAFYRMGRKCHVFGKVTLKHQPEILVVSKDLYLRREGSAEVRVNYSIKESIENVRGHPYILHRHLGYRFVQLPSIKARLFEEGR